MTPGQLLLLRRDDRLLLARVAAVRASGVCKAEIAAGKGAETVRFEPAAVAAQLHATAADWPAAEARLAAAEARVSAADLEAAWRLLVDEPCGTGAVARLVCGADTPTARDDALLIAGLQDDAFRTELGQLLPRSTAERTALLAVRGRQAAEDLALRPWLRAWTQHRAGERGDKAALAQMGAELQHWLTEPLAAPLAAAWLARQHATTADQTRLAMATLCSLGQFDAYDDAEWLRSPRLRSVAAAVWPAVPPHFPAAIAQSDLPWLTLDNDAPHEIDDALCIQAVAGGTRLSVAIAHPTCWLLANDPVDRAARARGATTYHPRQIAPMLPQAVCGEVASLIAGAWRPALVFSTLIGSDGRWSAPQVSEAWIRVSAAWRYDVVDRWLAEPTLATPQATAARALWAVAQTLERARIANGAWLLYKPEVDVRAPRQGRTQILDASQTSPARRIVTEAMVLACAVAAQFGRDHHLPLPFRQQPPPHNPPVPPGLYTDAATVFAVLRCLQPSTTTTEVADHGVLGVGPYCQVTSPLRRYADVIAHRQLVAYLRGTPLLSGREVLDQLAVAEPAALEARQIQRKADKMFKLVWLAGQPPGQWLDAQVVRELAQGVLAFVPALALEIPLRSRTFQLGDTIRLQVKSIQPLQNQLEVYAG